MGCVGPARQGLARGDLSLPLASYKLRFADEHVRAVPARDEAGCLFAGPGVDLRGPDARAVLDEAGPVRAWLEAREPGIVLRSVSVDRQRLRVLVTLVPSPATTRPRVLRFDPPHATELIEAASGVEARVSDACVAVLRRRAARP